MDITRSRIAGGRSGITLIELLVVIAIIGVIAGLGAVSGRLIAQNASERAALTTVQQAVWQGATLAAARGFRTVLCREGVAPVLTDLVVRQVVVTAPPAPVDCSGAVLRRFEIDEAVTLDLAAGPTIVFTPPGTILAGTLPASINLTAAGNAYELEVSLIGEVRVQ